MSRPARLYLPPGYAGIRGGPPSLILVHFEIGPVSPQGKSLAPPYRQWSRSWNKQACQLMEGQWKNGAVSTIKDTGGTNRSSAINGMYMNLSGVVVGDLTHGIVVGTSTQAENRDDYVLITPVAHGNGAGQLWYQAATNDATLAITGGYRLVHSRQVDNNSGADIVITEMALYGLASSFYFCFLRDVLASSYTVANGASAVGRYKVDFLV